MNFKSASKLFFLFGACVMFLQARDVDSVQDLKECRKFIEGFVEDANSSHVEYVKGDGRLTLYSHPSAMQDLFNALKTMIVFPVGALCLGAGIWGLDGLLSDDWNHLNARAREKRVKIFFGLIGFCVFGAGCLLYSVADWIFILKHIVTRNMYIPYLTLDSKGLKRFDKYVLKWEDVDSVTYNFSDKTYTTKTEQKTLFTSQKYATYETHHQMTYYVYYVNKFGKTLISLSSDDELLPVSYEDTKALISCYLNMYGCKKFRQA